MPQTELRTVVQRMVDAGESEENIAAVIRRLSPPKSPAPKPEPRGLLSRSTPEDFPVYNLAKGIGNAAKKIPGAVYQMVTDPIGTVQALGEAQGRVGVQAKEAFDRGDYLTAVRKGVNYALPVVGPMMDPHADNVAAGGSIAEMIGELGTDATLMALGGRPSAPRAPKPPILRGPTNPKDAAAVAFAREQGIPLDLGTATGRQLLKNTQKRVGNTIGGEAPAIAMQEAQAQGLARVGGELAETAGPKATNPVAAGEAVRGALTKQIQESHQAANTHYTKARAGAGNATVDVSATKAHLKPFYDRLMREAEIAPPQGGKAKAIQALDRLMTGPDVAHWAEVDAALGDFKALARGADLPELRTQGQGIAATAVSRLDAQVRAAAAKAGPDVLKALEEGRAATKQKYAASDVLDMLSGEPGQVFKQLTQSKDVGVARLRAVQQMAPKEMPTVGRAFLEDLMEQARSKGGFDHADKLWADWQKLGGETKARLFPKQGQIADLDNFFLLAKKMKENPNPSGTAQVAGSPRANVIEVLAYLPSKAVAKMLYSPEAVKYLTTAQRVSTGPSKAARSLALAQVTKAAQSAGVSLDAIPAFAEEDRRSTPKGKAQ